MKFKKILVLVIAVVVMTGILASCAGGTGGGGGAAATPTAGETPAAAGDEAITLRISWWGNQLRNETTLAFLDAYTELNPHVTFEAEFTDWGGYWDRLATQAAAGNLPDIIQQDYGYIAQYHARGLLANLTELYTAGYMDVSEVPESVLTLGRFGGDLYALCIGVNAVAIFYNIDAAEAAGVSWSERPSYQELMEFSAAVFDATGIRGDTPGGMGGLQMMARDVGEFVYDVDASGNNIVGASEATVLRFFNQIYTTINMPWSLTVEQRQDAIGVGLEADHLPTGRSWVMFPGGSNQLAAVQAATEDRIGINFYPRTAEFTHEAMYLRPSQFFSIASTSQHIQESARVLDFYTNDGSAQLHLMAERGVPVNPRMAEYLRPHLDPVQQTIFEYIARVTEIGTPFDPPFPNGAAEANRLLDDLVDLIRFGQMTPEVATARWIPEANDILAVHQD